MEVSFSYLFFCGSLCSGLADDAAEKGDIILEGPPPCACQLRAGAWPVVMEILLHLDIAGLLKRADMGAEIAFSGAGERLEAL